MSRATALIVFVVLLGGLFFLPSPAPVRLAANETGTLLRLPAELPAGTDWRAALGAGDRVRLPDGREGEVRSVDGDRVLVRPAGASTSSPAVELARAEVAELLEPRPLWRWLTDGPATAVDEDGVRTLLVKGFRMDLAGTPYKDQRLHARVYESVVRGLLSIAAEEGFQVEFQQRTRQDFPGVLLFCNHSHGELRLDVTFPDGTAVSAAREYYPPTNRALAPPVIAILIAILFRRPLLALGAGVLAGAVLGRMVRGAGLLQSLVSGGGRVVTHYLGDELLDPSRQQVLLFLVCMFALVGIITRAGGIQGLMERLARFASGARRSQAAAFAMGVAVFFDHYANTLLVGTTMRPLTDRFRVAREKLAFLVDSTAAPVAGLSIFRTWIAFEVSTFSVHLPEAGLAATQGYEVFLRTMPYRFYSIFALFLVALLVITGRDFGPMLHAERRARRGQVLREGARLLGGGVAGGLEPVAGVKPRASVACLPLATFIVVTLAAMVVRGSLGGAPEDGFVDVLFRGSGTAQLLIGAVAGLVAATGAALGVGLRGEALRGAWIGIRTMGIALALLCLAWMLGAVCRDLGTATFLSVNLQEMLNPLLLPVFLFGLAAMVAFATGSSWSTMTILLPLVVGVSFEAGLSTPLGGEGMLIVAIGSVLEGAIFGDHCSPLSDTTVMSSTATSCDHLDHVRTQAPYAGLAMATALVCGYFPAVIAGLSPYLSLALGAAAMTGFVLWYGERVDEPVEAEVPAAPAADGAEPEMGRSRAA